MGKPDYCVSVHWNHTSIVTLSSDIALSKKKALISRPLPLQAPPLPTEKCCTYIIE